ncbi:LOW QUALITY PROTEIN: DNA polymerase lambda-like [Haliotis rubra]|uniref:LOW QUALITY PROTEIN: DNA polymerase lambda-like n=1 Tax=Haliotis rubra TaxID=36100 RepID=UPI001EE51D0B|nr:LOW QUALITY PROTEIN: DNA polymerase lambda-like [Haliotis rubra]
MPPKKRKNDQDNTNNGSKKRKLPDTLSAGNDTLPQFLEDISVFILPASIEKARMQIFRNNVEKYGGVIDKELTTTTSYLVVDDKMEPERLCKLLKLEKAPPATVVKSSWLSGCFRTKTKIETEDHTLDISCVFTKHESPNNSDSEETSNTMKSEEKVPTSTKPEYAKAGVMFNAFRKAKNEDQLSDSDYVQSDGEESEMVGHINLFTDSGVTSAGTSSADTTPNTSPMKQLPVDKWICAQSSKSPKPNLNKHITDKLEEMVKNYESTNDKWRAFGYQKAIQALRRHPKPITTWEEARSLTGVGAKLADKVWEIVESGGLRKLEEFKSNEELKILNMFTDLWGSGPHTARVWYQQGFRSLEDLRTKANLTHQQKVGLRLYDDLLDRMPREEAGEIEQVVKKAAESIHPGIIAQALLHAGSYRYGQYKTCGDVDVLVTHPDGKSHQGVYGKLIAKLKEEKFLTDDLVSAEDNGNQKKYLGVCRLPGENRKHRRLDIIVVPYDEYGCALVYFTGSAHFNRSLRHLCKKMHMSLNEHALKTGVVRKGGEKIYDGTTVPTPTEDSVFQALGVPVRPPEERDH